jgi:Fic family protein
MVMQQNQTNRVGTLERVTSVGEPIFAYVPKALPPDPALDVGPLLTRLERANRALGRLDGVASVLPSTSLFVFMYVRKEALLSSQIEGTQSSLSDLLLYETDEVPFVPLDDVQEVSSYIAAINHGLKRISEDFPLSLRLISEMHQILLSTGRGSTKQPGEFRSSQNWIGGTRPGNAIFVPPPPHRVLECMGSLESFFHDRDNYPVLIRAALAHVQFETIHPFLDGNGRLGRMLITLMLCEDKALHAPLLYLSLYLKTHRTQYYELLQIVRETGNWEAWIEFFLDGVIETSDQGFETARRLQELFFEDTNQIKKLGRAVSSALRVHADLQRSPLASVPDAAKRLQMSQPTLQKSIQHLLDLNIVREVTGKKRQRLYEYTRYLQILDEGTEPLPR